MTRTNTMLKLFGPTGALLLVAALMLTAFVAFAYVAVGPAAAADVANYDGNDTHAVEVAENETVDEFWTDVYWSDTAPTDANATVQRLDPNGTVQNETDLASNPGGVDEVTFDVSNTSVENGTHEVRVYYNSSHVTDSYAGVYLAEDDGGDSAGALLPRDDPVAQAQVAAGLLGVILIIGGLCYGAVREGLA